MQPRQDYWWLYLKNLDRLHALSVDRYSQTNGSYFYDQMDRVADFALGKSDEYDNGVVFGMKLIPSSQNGLSIGGYGGFLDIAPEGSGISSTGNYDIRCVNPEYQSSPFGSPELTRGSIATKYYFVNNTTSVEFSNGYKLHDNGLLNSASETIQSFSFSPPNNLQEVMIFSTIYLKYRLIEGRYFLVSGHDFATGDDIDPLYRTIYRQEKLSYSNFKPQRYRKEIFNDAIFPSVPDKAIDIARVVWRIGTTMDGEDHIYEYYIYDTRNPIGYYGWRQIEVVNFISSILRNTGITPDMTDQAKSLWSIVFNEMEWGDGFIDYWTTYWTNWWNEYWTANPAEEPPTQVEKDIVIYNSIPQTMRDLANELES